MRKAIDWFLALIVAAVGVDEVAESVNLGGN